MTFKRLFVPALYYIALVSASGLEDVADGYANMVVSDESQIVMIKDAFIQGDAARVNGQSVEVAIDTCTADIQDDDLRRLVADAVAAGYVNGSPSTQSSEPTKDKLINIPSCSLLVKALTSFGNDLKIGSFLPPSELFNLGMASACFSHFGYSNGPELLARLENAGALGSPANAWAHLEHRQISLLNTLRPLMILANGKSKNPEMSLRLGSAVSKVRREIKGEVSKLENTLAGRVKKMLPQQYRQFLTRGPNFAILPGSGAGILRINQMI